MITAKERALIRRYFATGKVPAELGRVDVSATGLCLLDALEAAEREFDELATSHVLLDETLKFAEARAEKAERERDVCFAMSKWLAEAIVHRLECGDCPAAFFGDEACQPDRKPDEPCLREGVFCWLDLACKRTQRAEQQAACVSQVSDKEACASENGKSERQKPCSGCGGKGGLEYEPGLLTHVCRECSGTGKQTSQGEGDES